MDKKVINFKIDGKEYQAEPGQTILKVAEAGGIAIPTLCQNDKISRTTSCFVCLVKDAKIGKFLPSCSAMPVEGGEYLSENDEVRDMRKTALELLLSEHSGDCEAPCTIACPAHARVEEYVRAGKKGDFLECLKIVKEKIPLPMSIGRVCPRFCEKDCRKNVTGEAVCINDFKRLAADMYYDSYVEEMAKLNGKKVAIVGAGPGGLAAAYFLRLAGVKSKIFDKQPAAGGMLRYGIPEYRLPKKAVLDKEIAHFTNKMDVEIEYGKELDKNLKLDDLKKNYDAVVIAVGCWKSSPMGVEGEDLVQGGIKWLEVNNCGGKNPGRVVVVGGGNTAMDCLRTSVRLGSPEVTCCYRRTENEMPADKLEIHEAKEEGVKFSFLTAPISVKKKGDHLVMLCQRMELGEPDASGRRKPVPVQGDTFEIECDTVIAAIGQATVAPAGMPLNKRGDIVVGKDNQIDGKVFGAGDCVVGAATVVEGVASGRKTAIGILNFLGLSDERPERTINVSRGHWFKDHLKKDDLVFLRPDVSEAPRVKQPLISIEKRKGTFEESALTISKEAMMEEGKRCIECSCTAKSDCKLKRHSETYGARVDAIRGKKQVAAYDNRHPKIMMDRKKCIKCGTCVKICKEVVNQNLLSLKNRGFYTNMSTAFDKVLPVSCSDCGKCVEECPVGALDWRIKA